ncbi:crosslink repair DNA glycosylase YcaQ family protein [Nocardioides sp. CN2-186]|uniref:DNA glycosylase AlkZ-like family protein n=1 Tax=Nocardioides tweenelious TaxID=3156607 RepID=UPI0032B4D4AA
MLELSRTDARRIAVRAQLLAEPCPTDLLAVVRHLTAIQHDQTAHVAPSADLVLWSRLGASYALGDVEAPLEEGRIVDLCGFLRPVEDVRLFRDAMARWPWPLLRDWQEDVAGWVHANDACRRDLLDRLRQDGPLTAADLPDTCEVPWRSSGWNNNRNVQRLLDLMEQRGEIAAVGRAGRHKLWDLADRIYPDDDPDEGRVPAEEAWAIREQRRLRSLGIVRPTGEDLAEEPVHAAIGDHAVIDGVKGEWRVDPEQLGQPFTGRTALISPLDRLVIDRKRMTDLFEFDYQLEMYKPAAKRRWGYFALPVLHGDRLVGKADLTADRTEGALVVNAVHEDEPFAADVTEAVDAELADLARCLGLELTGPQVEGA